MTLTGRLLFISIFFISCFKPSQNLRSKNQDLTAELASMKALDQQWRNRYTELSNQAEKDEAAMEEAIQKMQEVDSLHLIRLKAIFNQYGYVGKDVVGEQGAHDFWLLMQHCDDDPLFQEKVLDAMEVEVKKKNVDPTDYAYLRDRVCVNLDKPQVYGTQMQLNADSTSYEPKLLLDPDKVDKRRKSVGLGPIEFYINTMNSRFHGNLKKE